MVLVAQTFCESSAKDNPIQNSLDRILKLKFVNLLIIDVKRNLIKILFALSYSIQ